MADISKSPARIAGMFDAIAARYDFLNHLLSAGIDRRWRRQAIASLRLTPADRVLDLCTGTADLALAAARSGAANVVGIDFSAAMLEIGRQKVRRESAKPEKLDRNGLARRVRLVRGDATCIPVANASVDVVTAAFGVRNVVDLDACFREIHRVLAPGGRLAILEFANPTAPGVRSMYRMYSTHILPRIGSMISGNGEAYGYLPASIEAFTAPARIVQRLEQTGFTHVAASPLTLGVVVLYTARC